MTGAKDLSAIVRSMKALAASSVAQYEQSVESLRDYTRTVEFGLSVCLGEVDPTERAPGKSRPIARGAIVFGSDQGLVGRFNEVLIEFAGRTLHGLADDTQHLWVVGERMQGLVTEAGFPSPELFSVPNSVDGITALVGQILIAIEAAQQRGEVTEFYVYHNQPIASAGYQPISTRLLPLDAMWRDNLTALRWRTKMVPDVIDGAAAALPVFIREYLFILLFQACAQSLASENASRLAAMQRAEENIGDILGELARKYHRIRQASIDEELFEVVSGYEALKKHRPFR